MRSPSQSQSALRAPLNDTLGTEVNVRILRLLATTTVPMSKAAMARRAALNESGVGRVIEELLDRGIVESLGAGSRRLFRLRTGHPLASPLADLFAAELARFESMVEELRSAAQLLKPSKLAVAELLGARPGASALELARAVRDRFGNDAVVVTDGEHG